MKKLKLESVQVQSFVTKQNEADQLRGGHSGGICLSYFYQCGGSGAGLGCDPDYPGTGYPHVCAV